MVQSFDWRTLQLVQQRAPAIPTVYLTLQAPRTCRWQSDRMAVAAHGGSLPRTIKDAGGAIWSPYFGDVTPERIPRVPRPRAQNRGLDRQPER